MSVFQAYTWLIVSHIKIWYFSSQQFLSERVHIRRTDIFICVAYVRCNGKEKERIGELEIENSMLIVIIIHTLWYNLILCKFSTLFWIFTYSIVIVWVRTSIGNLGNERKRWKADELFLTSARLEPNVNTRKTTEWKWRQINLKREREKRSRSEVENFHNFYNIISFGCRQKRRYNCF